MKLPWLRPAQGRRRANPDEHVSVMQPWTIWVGAFVVLVVGAVSGWVLLGTFGGGSSQDKVRLEILKLTGSIVLGTGGGVALLLAARRQRATEVDIAYRKVDATERRVTELYTAAAEQLGSDKAAVRLAGLYALERLAQYNPDHRQTIVDVICAYLRMPYTPPSENTHSARVGGGRARGLREPNRSAMSPSPIRTVTTIASTFNHVIDPREEQRQEFQVRMAAQRLLTAHLRPEPNEQGDPTNWKFWPNVDIDLTGAVLTDWDMCGCRADRATFTNAEFRGDSNFYNATFRLGARFSNAELRGTANFDNVTFGVGGAWFSSVTFEGRAEFLKATFEGSADFRKATFEDSAQFLEATFRKSPWFLGAMFEKDAMFSGATFEDYTLFSGVTFKRLTDFQETTFKGQACFKKSTFKVIAGFRKSNFEGIALFEEATFGGMAEFRGSTFEGAVSFQEATFEGPAKFSLAAFHVGVDFRGARAIIDISAGVFHEWPPGWELREYTHYMDPTGIWGTLVSESDDAASVDAVD